MRQSGSDERARIREVPYPPQVQAVDSAGVRRRRSSLPREICIVSVGTVERRTQTLDERVEVRLGQNLVQPLVERMPGAPRQVRRCHPHRVLGLVVAGRAHRHGRPCSTRDRSCRSLAADQVGHPEGRSAAEDGGAVDAPGVRRLSKVFLMGERASPNQPGPPPRTGRVGGSITVAFDRSPE